MGNMFGMLSIAFLVIRTLKCEVVNFLKLKWAGIPVRLFKYLSMLILIIAHATYTCIHDVHAHCDITRFAYDANHVTMTSPVFTFHSCHVELRWNDVISVHIVQTPCHYGSHCMGMT